MITGAGRGLGLSFAHAVAQVGGNVVAIDVHDTPDVDFQKLSQYKVKAKYYQSVSSTQAYIIQAYMKQVQRQRL